jgi:hypothetical protein
VHNAEWTGNAGTDQWNMSFAHFSEEVDGSELIIDGFASARAGECLEITILTLNNQPSNLNLPLGQRREGNPIPPRLCFARGEGGSELELISVGPQEFLKSELARSARVRQRA